MWWSCPQITIQNIVRYNVSLCQFIWIKLVSSGLFHNTNLPTILFLLFMTKPKFNDDLPRYTGAIEQVVFRKTSNLGVKFISNFGEGVGKVALLKMQLHTSLKDLLDLHKLHTFPSHPQAVRLSVRFCWSQVGDRSSWQLSYTTDLWTCIRPPSESAPSIGLIGGQVRRVFDRKGTTENLLKKNLMTL